MVLESVLDEFVDLKMFLWNTNGCACVCVCVRACVRACACERACEARRGEMRMRGREYAVFGSLGILLGAAAGTLKPRDMHEAR